MTNGRYWSSTPDVSNSNYAWIFLVSDDSIDPGNDYNHNGSQIRSFNNNVRCIKNSYEAPTTTYTLELDANGGVVAEDELETDSE